MPKFMVFVKASADSEAGVPPSAELLTEMMKFNDEMSKAGILLDGQGLHPSSNAVRIEFDGKKRTVVDGPFAEAKELVAGYWLLDVKSKQECIEWMKRCPNPTGATGTLEIRPLFDMSDFPHAPSDVVTLAAEIQARPRN